jgi:predicted DCC family thiol-disulfide oxidoreductase YuxK
MLRVLPCSVRDWVYDLIARNRYRWFGRADVCLAPTPELMRRFVDADRPASGS